MWIIVAIAVALLFVSQCQAPIAPIANATSSVIDSGGGGGGGGGSSTQTSGSTSSGDQASPWLFLFNLFNPAPQCSRDSDCENICANPASAHCTSGKCSCGTSSSEPEAPVSQCSRNSDCDYLCAASNSGVCNSGSCGCSSPVAPSADTCSDSDLAGSRGDDSTNYLLKGTCQADLVTRGVTDYCAHGMLIEYYCRSGSYCAVTEVDCETVTGTRGSICLDGACT